MIAAVPAGVFRGTFEHERVQAFRDPAGGLSGIIAIHSTALGPAMGGLGVRAYADAEAAIRDAPRLSQGMTLKNAAAGLDLGGARRSRSTTVSGTAAPTGCATSAICSRSSAGAR